MRTIFANLVMAEANESSLINIQNGSDQMEHCTSVSKQNKEYPTDEDESVSLRRDIEFCELYFKVIDKQLARGDYEENIKEAVSYYLKIRSRTDEWCRFKEGIGLEEINLLKQSFYYRMRCIYTNAACISSAVAYYFENFLNQNLKSLKGLLNKNILKICSIGGGMPADVVALIRVLESSIYIQDDVEIQVTVIDVDKKWKKPCLAILHSMKTFSKDKWKIDFANLDPSSQSVSSKIAAVIKEADFISLFKFLIQLEDQDTEFKRNFFLNLSHLVSPGSVLFVMDDVTNEVMQVYQGYLGRLHGHNILLDVPCHLHKLQLPAVKRHYELYNKRLIGTGICNTSFKLFCRAWIRNKEIFLSTGSRLQSFDPLIKKAEKSLQEKKDWHCQLRSLCQQLSNNKTPEGWKDCFVTEMKNQELNDRKSRKMLKAAEKDIHLRKLYAKQLMLASYQDFLDEARELRGAQKESDETLKDKKRKNFFEMKKRADIDEEAYKKSIKSLLYRLQRI